jgi:hypothetical protein
MQEVGRWGNPPEVLVGTDSVAVSGRLCNPTDANVPSSRINGADPDAPVGRGAGPACVRTLAGDSKPSINRAIPPLCQKAVASFVKLYPTLSVMDMVKKGGIKFEEVQIGNKGDCSNFNLLGKCRDPNCTYKHKPAKVGEERQVTVAKKIDQAMAKMKGAGPA